ncbi:MAG: hydrolase [Planctomycetota bacterium]
MNSKYWQAHRWLETQADQMAKDLIELCNINSGSDNPQGLCRAADWLEEFFEPLSVPCQRIDLPSYQLLDDAAKESSYQTGPALRWDLGNPHSQGILWTIHYDTVYGKDDPFQSCDLLPNNKLRGPGVIDAKGGIIIMRYAALALKQFHEINQSRLTLILTPDEEIGSPASVGMWQSIAKDFQSAFLFEPTMADGSLVQARKGTGTFIFVVRGKSAHAGRNFHEGRNAIAHCCELASQIHRLNGQKPTVTINIGRIRGGNAVNVVPDTAVMRVNVRIANSQDQLWIEEQLKDLVSAFDQPQSGYRVELSGGIHAPAKICDQPTQRLKEKIELAALELGQSIHWKESGGASDGNKLQSMGLPNIDTLGPRGDALHSDQEWIELDSLVEKAQLTCATFSQGY